jgi:hypothetical protein
LSQLIHNANTLITQTIDLQIALEITTQIEATLAEITQIEIIQTGTTRIEITQIETTRIEIIQTEIIQIEISVAITSLIMTFIQEIILDADSLVVDLAFQLQSALLPESH